MSMNDILFNAHCRIIEPLLDASGTDRLSRKPRDVRHDPQRCSFRQMSMTQQASVLGGIAPHTYTLRLQSKLNIKAGWRVLVMIDGEDEWKEYEVKAVRKGFCLNLQVEGVQ